MIDGPRYIAREHQIGRFWRWSVYDQQRASYPGLLRGKRVPDGLATAPEAQGIADALNDGSFWTITEERK